jgi:hypothetical protein
MTANRELADGCIALSAETEDSDSASELLRISYRLLQLADPNLPPWESVGDLYRQQRFGTA